MIYQFLKSRLVVLVLLLISASKALPVLGLTNQLVSEPRQNIWYLVDLSIPPMSSECIDYLFEDYSQHLEAYVQSHNLRDDGDYFSGNFTEDEDAAMAIIAIKSLSLCGSESVPILRSSLRSLIKQEKGPIITIVNSLGDIGEDASESLPELVHVLNNGTSSQRCKAARAIGQIKNKDSFIVNRIYDLLKEIEIETETDSYFYSSTDYCRRDIFQALGLLGEVDFAANSLLQELESIDSVSEGMILIDLLKPLDLDSNTLASRLIRSINQSSTSRESKISLILALGILTTDYDDIVNTLDTIAYNSTDSSLLASTAFSLVITGNSKKSTAHLIKSLKNLPEPNTTWEIDSDILSLQLFIANSLSNEDRIILGKELVDLVRKSGLNTQDKSLKILRSIEFSDSEYIDYLFEVITREECSQSLLSSPAVIALAMTAFCSTETLRLEAIQNLGEIERKNNSDLIREFFFDLSLNPDIDYVFRYQSMYELSQSPFIDDNIFDHIIKFIGQINEVMISWNEAILYLHELNTISELDDYFLRVDVDPEAMYQSIAEARQSSSINETTLNALSLFHEINEQMYQRAKIIDKLAETINSENRKEELANILTGIIEKHSYYDTDLIHSSVFALGEMRIEDSLVANILNLVFSQGNPKTQVNAAEAIGKIGDLDRSISYLLSILENEENLYSDLFRYGIHRQVVSTLQNIGSPATMNLADKLSTWKNLSPSELRSLVYVLSQLKDIPASSIPLLVEVLNDQSRDLKTRRFAAYALDTFEDQEIGHRSFYEQYNLIPVDKVNCESHLDEYFFFDSYWGRCISSEGLNGGADLLLRIQCLLGRC